MIPKKKQFMSDVGLFCRYTLCEDSDILNAPGLRWEKCIGMGMSGYVGRAHLFENQGIKMAVKVFDRKLQREQEKNKKELDLNFLREVAILQHIEHPYILSNVQACASPNFRTIIMPYYPGGSLFNRLPHLTTEWTSRYFVQLASAVQYLNRRGIVHRDIKPDNVLLKESGDAILADFGLAHVMKIGARNESLDVHGTRGYMPPEVEEGTEEGVDYYKSDSYALGVTLWNMLFRTIYSPYPRCPHCVCPKQIPKVFRVLIRKLCHHDMHKRWSVERIMSDRQHSFTIGDVLMAISQWR